MNRKKGHTLLYVLIILSTLSFFLMEFIIFTKKRYKNYSLTKESYFISVDTLIQKEYEFSDLMFRKGIFYDENKLSLENSINYYNSRIFEDTINKSFLLKRIIYFNQDTLSLSNFKIISIKDLNNNFYHLPLEENTLYPDLEIIYEKILLEKKLLLVENINFSRIDNDEVLIETKNFHLKGEE